MSGPLCNIARRFRDGSLHVFIRGVFYLELYFRHEMIPFLNMAYSGLYRKVGCG